MLISGRVQRTIGALAVSLFVARLAVGSATAATGWSLAAVPTSIQIVRNEGFIGNGPFGNTGTTPYTVPDALWVPIARPQYQSLLSTSLTAVAAGMKIQGYAYALAMGGNGGSFNEVSAGGTLIITK